MSSTGLHEVQLPDWRSECRYGIYTVRTCGTCHGWGASEGGGLRCAVCRGRGKRLVLLATAPTMQAVGVALCTQGEDCADADMPAEAYGVLDGHAGRWLAQPPWGAG